MYSPRVEESTGSVDDKHSFRLEVFPKEWATMKSKPRMHWNLLTGIPTPTMKSPFPARWTPHRHRQRNQRASPPCRFPRQKRTSSAANPNRSFRPHPAWQRRNPPLHREGLVQTANAHLHLPNREPRVPFRRTGSPPKASGSISPPKVRNPASPFLTCVAQRYCYLPRGRPFRTIRTRENPIKQLEVREKSIKEGLRASST